MKEEKRREETKKKGRGGKGTNRSKIDGKIRKGEEKIIEIK